MNIYELKTEDLNMLTTQKDRKDSWNQEEDELLAATVLRHIEENSTQLEAFKEVGEQLERTAGACGFRWNLYVRKKYSSQIQQAKQKRRQEKRKESKNISNSSRNKGKEILENIQHNLESLQGPLGHQENKQDPPIEEITHFIKDLFEKERRYSELKENLNFYKDSISELKAKMLELSLENKKLKEELHSIEQDYKRLSELIVQARKMVIEK